MIDVFKYEKRYWYPHMKPADIDIWERFIEKFPDAYDACQYDFNVGDPPPFNPFSNEDDDLNQDALYRLKIDVVAQKGNRIDIIELKPSAGAGTIGQVKAYEKLYRREVTTNNQIRPVIITDRLRANMGFLCQTEGVEIIVV